MKIAFTGAHGTGKSTLIHHPYWKQKFPEYEILDTVSRNYPQGWKGEDIQYRVNWKYITKHLIGDNFISARSFFDPWAYSRINVDKRFMIWYFILSTVLIKYDFLFYIPIEIALVDDKYRPLDKAYQKQVDKELVSLLDFFNVKYYTISGSIEQRIDTIDSIIL